MKLVKQKALNNELEYERALSADKHLRLLVRKNPELTKLRKELRDRIVRYEKIHWSDEQKVKEKQIKESDLAEKIAQQERKFIHHRKGVIRARLKKLDLKQQDLATLLGHNKSYISELLNGIRSFSSADLILLHRLLNIDLKDLFLTTVALKTQKRVKESLAKISSKKIRLKGKDLQLVFH
jgi:transcriptional regulator with XRE-family HTH domain